VAFVAGPLWETRLYVRQVEGGAPVAVTPARGGFSRVPRWSPDGSRLVFRSDRGLEVVPALGGQSRLIMSLEPGTWTDGSWSPDGRSILYAVGDSVHVRSVEGGPARALGRLPEAHSCAWSSDGARIACVSGNRQFVTNEDFGNIANCGVWVLPADGGTPVLVTDGESLNLSPVWVPGRPSLLYLSNREGGRDLYQVSLARSGRPVGGPTRLTTGLNAAAVSLSADGRRLAYAGFTGTSNIWSLPIPEAGTASASRADPVTTGNQVIELFDVSDDGRWLVFDSDRGGTQQIYRMPLGGGEVEQLTTDAEPAFYPSFSKDGREIAYHRFRAGHRQIFVIPAEGGTPTQVTTGTEHYRGPEWSPDGRTLAVQKAPKTPAQETDLVARDANGKWGVPRTLVKGGTMGVWTPDGRAVLTLTGELGPSPALEIAPAAGGARRVVVSVRDRTKEVVPAYIYYFSADGRVIYFLGREPSDRTIGIWQVPVAGGTPRVVVRFDDPSRPWHPYGFRVHGGKFYFTVGDRQSDIWTTEVEGSR
jgi:Tol biopolymer transport system component